MPEARLDGCLQWAHLSSGHTGCNRSVDFFRECFYSRLTLSELRSYAGILSPPLLTALPVLLHVVCLGKSTAAEPSIHPNE